MAGNLYGQQGALASSAANVLTNAPASSQAFTANNIRATDILSKGINSSATTGYASNIGALLGAKTQIGNTISAKDFSAMLNGGYGVMNGYQGYTGMPTGTDFASASANAGQSAAQGPQGVYVPGSSGGGMLGSALGAAGTLGAAWMMSR
jgi:hypothetical protein